jgi:hypothetical protein
MISAIGANFLISRGPGDIPEGSTLLSLVRSTPVFEEVYTVQDFTIYKFNPNDLEI